MKRKPAEGGGKTDKTFFLNRGSLGRRRRGSRRGGGLLLLPADGRADDGRGVAGAGRRVEEAEAVGFLVFEKKIEKKSEFFFLKTSPFPRLVC